MKYVASLLIVLMMGTLSTSCARQISSNVYSAHHVGESSRTYSGVIVSAREVTVEDEEYLGDNTAGIIGGGVGGALLGSMVGKGKGSTVATIAGAGLGAVGGAFAEKALKSQQAMEYVVALDNGESRTVVQGVEPRFADGQNVYLIVGERGRSRVVPKQ